MTTFLKIMVIVLVAELPCMIRTVALKLQSGDIWSVIWGTIVGSALALVCGLGIARVAGPHAADSPYINYIAGGLIVAIGLYMMFAGDPHQH